MSASTSAGSARTLARQAYHRLRHDIVSGVLPAGSKLKLENLVAHYAIGMSPLREALARLVGDQLVKTEDQRGFWVAPLSLEELDDISRVRTLIETEALRLSIEAGDDAWEQRVREAFAALSNAEAELPEVRSTVDGATMDAWEQRNQAFHSALVSACGSPWLIRLQELLYQQAERYRRVSLSYSQGRRFVHDEHVAIYEAVIARNTLRACRLTEEHLMQTYEAVRAQLARMQENGEASAA